MGQQSIRQARNTCDTLLLEVFRQALTSVTTDVEVAQLMYNPTFETGDAIRARNIMSDMQKYNAYVDDIYIINFSTGSVLTRFGRVQLENFYDQELLEWISDTPVTSVPIRYQPRIAVVRKAAGVLSEEKVWTVIFHPSVMGAFALNVNYEEFYGLLNFRTDSEYLNSYIINSSGQVLASTDETRFGIDVSDTKVMELIREQPQNEGSFTYQSDKDHQFYTVYYIQNAYLGLTYVSTVQTILLDPTEPLFLTILGLSALLLFLSVAGSILLTVFTYRPVRHLRNVLSLDESSTGNQDEFEQIQETYQSIQKKNDALQTSAEAWKKAKNRQMLLNWLEPSSISRRFTSEDYEPLNEYFVNLRFCCVLFTIDKLPGVSNEAEERGMVKYSIINMMDELCEGKFLVKSIDYSPSQTIHICNFEQLDRETMRSILGTIQKVLQEHFHSAASAIVGCTVEETEELPASLKSAKQTAARRFATGTQMLLFCDDPETLPQNLPYPQAEETRIMQAVRNGDQEEMARSLSAFFNVLCTCQLETAVLYLLQFDLSCQRLENANHLDSQPLDMSCFASPDFRLDDVYALIKSRLNTVLHSVASLKESNTTKLVSRVDALVVQHLCDPNLSIAGLADEIGLSVNYLRNIYKDATGESLSAHITAEKLKLICELLKTSDMTIQEISEKLGFTTRNYFFTFFKKHMGMTPKQYRLMQGNLND